MTPTLRPKARPGQRDLAGPVVFVILAGDKELAAGQSVDKWDALLDGKAMRRAVVALLRAAARGSGDPASEALDSLAEDERVVASRVLHDPPPLPQGSPREALESIEANLHASREKKRVSPLRGVVDNADPKRQT